MTWRLGLDIGTNSIGWAALALTDGNGAKSPYAIIESGVRIFSDGRNPKDRQSNAVARRLPRQQRRMRDRYLRRRSHFMDALIRHGLMPEADAERKALERQDPWTLRVLGLDEELSLHQLGRALFHLQQRRGFKSNRKTDKGDDDDSGKIKSAAKAVTEAMEETTARTLGEYLARARVDDPKKSATHPVRARLKGVGAKAHYDFYPTRALIEAEFDALWAAQNSHHAKDLTDDARDALKDILFFQRDLKPQPVGKCSLNPTEERAPRALPSVQRLRIYQEINNLRVRLPGEAERVLTLEERDTLVNKALATKQLTFDAARKALKFPDTARFNLEGEKRKHLDGDKTAAILAASKRWDKDWRDLDAATQETIVENLLDEEDDAKLLAWLAGEHGLSMETAEAVAGALLPDGHGQLGRTASSRVLDALKADVITYHAAVTAAGYGSHSELDFDGEVFDALPYYGEVLERHVAFGTGEPTDIPEKRYGKLANPTVHVALNQIRRVVNGLSKRFGPPAEIVVELARDLPLSAKGKSDLIKSQRQNQDANDARRKILAEMGHSDSYDNRLRLRLWEELNPDDPLDRRCPYTGDQIGQALLFSDAVEIEHILPFSRSLDDGIGNKTLSMRGANRFKEQKTPFEAFAASPSVYDWPQIAARATNLPNNKSWRFGPDAMDRYNNEERDFLARQLVDTQYMSRLATLYMQRTGASVWVTPGRFTANLRWAWGLDSTLPGHNRDEAGDATKNRHDHRHHAIDAVVVALTDRRLLQHIATVAGRAEERFDKRYLADFPEPWTDFRDTVLESIGRIVISHKPDHGVQGALHNDTAYGIIEGADAKGRSQVVHRVPLAGLKPKQLDLIRDPVIREHMKDATAGLESKAFTEALITAGETMSPPVRKIRIVETLSVIPTVIDADGKPAKAYKGDANYCYDIFAGAKGKWTGQVVSRFQANQKDFDVAAKTRPDGTALIMRIRGNDMVAMGTGDARRVFRVVKFSLGSIALAEHFEAGALKARDADKEDPFKYKTTSPSGLQKSQARLVHVSPAGRLFDPGPPE
jgi:CRISPR-associated endonuclease Csn1